MAPRSHKASSPIHQPSHTAAVSVTKEGSDAPTSSKQSRANSLSSNAGVLPGLSDPVPAVSGNGAAVSHHVTKSSSVSASESNPPAAKDAGGPSPYGTRSRNSRTRAGQSRPNYAEDKDVDMEIFENPRKGGDESKKSTRQQANSASHASQEAPPSVNASSRKPLPAEDGKHDTTQNVTKDQQHNQQAASTASPASTTNSSSAAPSSKKRKAATQTTSAGVGHVQTAATAQTSSSNAYMRRSSNTSGGGGGYSETNMLSFENTKARPKNNVMTADDGTVLAVNDYVYMVCEPPGEPYYIGRIMEFLHSKNNPALSVDALRINWFYRPRDIGRVLQDTRLLFATMHSDISPLTALRGKCIVKHRAEIANIDEYRKNPDNFWFDKMYDRYIQKNYEVIPTSQIVNVPVRVKKVLDERWKYILVELGRGKELTSASKSCKRCSAYCASNDSVDCAVCQNTYHMNCVRPPLLKKPSRGFAWSCAACSRAQERKLEARNTPNVPDPLREGDEEELLDEEEEDACAQASTNRTSPSEDLEEHPPPTAEQIHQASLWPYRYLGIHCKIEDALDYDDRIYPRASSRLGPRHQATVLPWPGRPVQLVKPLEVKKNGRKDARLSKEAQLALEKEKLEREKRPWIQDEPAGYIARGEDLPDNDPNCTTQCLWKPAEDGDGDIVASDIDIDDYMDKVRKNLPGPLGLPERSTNLLDVARNVMYKNNYDAEKAFAELVKVDKAVFKEPELSALEQKKFDEGVAKYGSELHGVKKHIKTVSPGNIVRYYYTWKKTDRGKQIWGHCAQRKGKKEVRKAEVQASKLADDVADAHDDSAFDEEKAVAKKRSFKCNFCHTKNSRQWRRAPAVTPNPTPEPGGKNKDKGVQYIGALCRRCAELWRRYAIKWEDMDEVAKKIAATGRAFKKGGVDQELMKELQAANERMNMTTYSTPDPPPIPAVEASATPVQQQPAQEPSRKKLKYMPDKDPEQTASEASSVSGAVSTKKKEKGKEKEKEKAVAEKPAPPPPPPVPEIPKPKTMPCAICHVTDQPPLTDQHLTCKECRMTVHRSCYGVIDNRHVLKWTCDMCANDKNPQLSIHYKCVLCPVESTPHDFVEPPKISHKKKTEKERERERMEKENAQKAADHYRNRQIEMNRPVDPREPLKRTADNNWVHVTCAVFTPEVKFGNAKALEPGEGIPSIPRARYGETCKACKQQGGACVPCHHCRGPVHVECAHQFGGALGFDITPVKGSRRDQHNIVTIGAVSGTMTAAVWCPEHKLKAKSYSLDTKADETTGLNPLQLYVQNFKQADLTLTGCARKANLITAAVKMSNSAPAPAPNRRASTTTATPSTLSSIHVNGTDSENLPEALQPAGKVCFTCGFDVSPKWHPIDESQERLLINGHHGSLGTEAQKFVDQRHFQCHQCHKNGRQPRPHPSIEDASLQPEMSRSSSQQALPSVASPSAVNDMRGIAATRPWSIERTGPPSRLHLSEVSGPPPASVSAPEPVAPLNAAPPLQGPQPAVIPVGPPQAQQMQPNNLPPRGPPPSQHQYPPTPGPGYNDWHRPSSQQSQHGPSLGHRVNGGPQHMHSNGMSSHGMPTVAPPNHLRPPSMSNNAHPPPPPPMQNGHMGQPMVNGMPQSPRRMSGPSPLQDGSPYMSPYHHAHHGAPPPHHLTNGGPPPRAPEHPLFPQALHTQRSPYGTPHGSPPTTRDSIVINNREPSIPPPRPAENRPASGASASPSLRNLLH